MNTDYQVNSEVITKLDGTKKLEALHLAHAEGQLLTPKPITVIAHRLLEERRFSKRYELHLNNGVKMFYDTSRPGFFRFSLKNRTLTIRYPKMIHIIGNEANLVFDRHPQRLQKLMRWLLKLTVVRNIMRDEPHLEVYRTSARMVGAFFSPPQPGA